MKRILEQKIVVSHFSRGYQNNEWGRENEDIFCHDG